MGGSVLAEIERYYDAVPRSSARVEQIGALTLFIGTGPGWGFYARPSLGTTLVAADEVELVRARQRHLTWFTDPYFVLRSGGDGR